MLIFSVNLVLYQMSIKDERSIKVHLHCTYTLPDLSSSVDVWWRRPDCLRGRETKEEERERERERGREGWLRWQEEVVVVEEDHPSVDHLHHRIIGKRLHQSRRIRASSIPSCRGRRGRRRQWCGKDGASRESGRFICVKFASRASRGPRNLERFLRSSLVWMTCTHSTPTS